MDKFIEVHNLEEYKNAIQEKSIFLLTATWYPDCILIKPFNIEIVDKYTQYKFYVIDRDEMIDLCKELDIMGIPSFVAFENGKETGRFVSKLRKTKEEIEQFIDSL